MLLRHVRGLHRAARGELHLPAKGTSSRQIAQIVNQGRNVANTAGGEGLARTRKPSEAVEETGSKKTQIGETFDDVGAKVGSGAASAIADCEVDANDAVWKRLSDARSAMLVFADSLARLEKRAGVKEYAMSVEADSGRLGPASDLVSQASRKSIDRISTVREEESGKAGIGAIESRVEKKMA